MPLYDIIVDDVSPMITYSPGWTDSNFTNDDTSSYFSSTVHQTNQKGENASTAFFGNDISVYGTRGNNYGSFSTTLDGQKMQHDATNAGSGDAQFQQLLFRQKNLGFTTHTIVITNEGDGTLLELDYFVFATGNGDPSVKPVNTTIDDSSSQIAYSGSWQTLENQVYFQSTTHESTTNGSTAFVAFSGDAISVYGTTGPDHGAFTVQIDGQKHTLNASASQPHSQTLLYFVGGLAHGDHSLVLMNSDNTAFDMDFIVSSSWSFPVRFPTSLKHLSTANIPVIAGVLSGACVIIFWSIALFLWARRQHRKRLGLRPRPSKEIQPLQDFIIPPDPAVEKGLYKPGDHLFEDKKAQMQVQRTHSSASASKRHSNVGTPKGGPEDDKAKPRLNHLDENTPRWSFDEYRPSTDVT